MKTLLCVTSLKGGGGASATKLAEALRKSGVHADLLVSSEVNNGDGNEKQVHVLPRPVLVRFLKRIAWHLRLGPIEQWPLRKYPERKTTPFSVEWLPDRLPEVVSRMKPDVVTICFMAGLARIESLPKLGLPIVWKLSDCWPFTGGCYLPGDCNGYLRSCGCCPQLASRDPRDLSNKVWNRKAKFWSKLDLTLVSPSRWLAERARASSLFGDVQVKIIPTGVDTIRFIPRDRAIGRNILGLDPNRKTILFAAWQNVPNKGFQFLLEAIRIFGKQRDGLQLLVFGFPKPEEMPELGIPCHFLGTLRDELAKAIVYATADVFVAPSMEENFPNTVLEALSCGTPCVAYRIGGMPELIDHMSCGYIAEPFEVDDLAQGIRWVLEDDERHRNLARQARDKVETYYSLERYGEQYRNLFSEILGKDVKAATESE